MPHPISVVVESDSSGVASVDIDPNTIVIISGVVNASWNQRVKADLIDGNQNSQDVAVFEGVSKEALHLDDDSSKKAVTWGPFDEQMTVELTFEYKDPDEDDWDLSTVEIKKIKEHSTLGLQSAISIIPASDGSDSDDDNVIVNLTRMTL